MVYTMSKRVNPSINAISTLVVVFITISLLIANIIPVMRQKIRKKEVAESGAFKQPKKGPKIVIGLLIAALAIGLFSYKKAADDNKPFAGQTLHVYNWGEYVGENFLSNFEEQTGAKVVMDNFDSNEQMYIKVANNESYDVLVPSDYMIQRLILEDLLQPLDREKIQPSLDLLDPNVLDQPFDPGNQYSVPYFWGSVGIVYDKRKVDVKDLEEEGFNIFLDPKYKGIFTCTIRSVTRS